MREIADSPRFVPVSLADDLTWEEFARINVRAPELPGLQPDMGEARVYPFGGAFAHVVGYVSKITQADLDKAGPDPDPLLLHPGFRIGKQGIEKSLDAQLRGKPGGQKVEVDSRGRMVREDPNGDIKPVPGDEVVLTLDADIQNRALEVFGEESGAAVMMDCRTGDVLCLMSAPSFDANKFVKGLSAADYQALAQYDHKPLFNKALTATYPPGSTFKTMVALAALEHGYDPKTVHVCNKVWSWGGRPWHCDKAHGAQDLHGAIATSCDIYFYQCALSVGPDRIAETARKFGLGELHDIGLPPHEQRPGLIPDTAYKRRAFPNDPVWHPGETPSMGIGQGYVNVNALQLCVQAARLANGRKALQPRLVHSIGGIVQPSGAQAPDLPFANEHIDFVRTAMASVVQSGTAAATAKLGLGSVQMAGKTGTAQAHNYAGGSHGAHGAQGAWALRDHAWFIAFAPYDDPRYAMSVLVEHGGFGGEVAAPKAREIMRVALLKDPEIRARVEQPMPLPATPPGERVEGAEPPGNPA
jgi:penicillin-binding protein 2